MCHWFFPKAAKWPYALAMLAGWFYLSRAVFMIHLFPQDWSPQLSLFKTKRCGIKGWLVVTPVGAFTDYTKLYYITEPCWEGLCCHFTLTRLAVLCRLHTRLAALCSLILSCVVVSMYFNTISPTAVSSNISSACFWPSAIRLCLVKLRYHISFSLSIRPALILTAAYFITLILYKFIALEPDLW